MLCQDLPDALIHEISLLNWSDPEREICCLREEAPPDHWMPASGDLCTTVIPAQAGIQGWGFPARNASHLRHAVSHRGSYANVSFRGHDGRLWRPPRRGRWQNMDASPGRLTEGVDASREECPGCGCLAKEVMEGVDASESRAPPDHWVPASEDLCTTVIPAQARIAQPSFPRRRESRGGGSPLGMLAISATLSPTGGVTQRSPSAGMTVGCGGLAEGVDGRIWMPRQRGRWGVWMPPE